MKIGSLEPGMVVFSLSRGKLGNTTLSTVSVHRVFIKEVDKENGVVTASWNGNPPRKYFSGTFSKWRLKEPKLIDGFFGSQRLARRGE